MNLQKVKEKMQQNKYLLIFSVLIFLFMLFLTRPFIKMDDGHFLGILSTPDFNLLTWLKYRYLNVSGRTVSEGLMMLFLSLPFPLWQIANAGWIIFITFFINKILLSFKSQISAQQKSMYACSLFFLIFIACLNPSVFWFAGSFTYLWPFGAFIGVIKPYAYELFHIKEGKVKTYLLSLLFMSLAMSQEQTAACTLVFLVVFLFALWRKKNIKIYKIIPFILSLIGAIYLFSSSGMLGRALMESAHFPRFLAMNSIEKIGMGFSNFIAHTLFTSVLVLLLFLLNLYVLLYQKKILSKKQIISHGVFAFLICIGAPILYSIFNNASIIKASQTMFQSGNYQLGIILVLMIAFIFLLSLETLIVLLIKKAQNIGYPIFFLFNAAIAASVVVGFSSSIYASGQRIFFFTDLFLLIAGGVIFANLQKNKTANRILNLAVGASIIFFLVAALAFVFFEFPLMG